MGSYLSQLSLIITKTLLALVFICSFSSCNETKDLKDALDLELDPPERKPIDTTRMGVNNFFVNRNFGNIKTQYSTIKNTLKLNHVRILLACSNEVLPSPSSSMNFSFYDDILKSIPKNMDAIVVLAHAPNWMNDSSNWIGANPRKTWVERCFKPLVKRYANTPRITGYEIWNEPDLIVLPADNAMGFSDPLNYMELVRLAVPVIRKYDPSALAIMAATQSIQQSYSSNLDYNRALRDNGIQDLVDIYNIHYYGEQFENVIRSGGIQDFLKSIRLPIWITESGERGVNKQLKYVETAWPFLREKIPTIDRIYYYELNSLEPANNSYGLMTKDPAAPVSDLYIHLRDR